MSILIASRSRSSFSSFVLVCLLGLLCSFIVPHRLTAQVSTTGKITGTVADSSGGAVPNAAVSVKSTALLVPRSTHTEADGSYLFDLLPPGTYELTVTAPGFNTYNQIGIILTAGFTATVNSKLKVGEVTQVIKVESEPVVDLQNNQTSATFDQTLLQDIPSGRDPWSTVGQMPGAVLTTFDVAGNNSYQQSTMQVHGSTPGEQIFSFNGLDLNWPGANGGYTQFYTNHDSFDEFQVVADSAPASVPIGGVYMNMVTKSGSNQLHGQAAIYYLTAAMQAGVKFPTYNGAPVTSGNPFDMTRDTTASLGGPLMKDRWWLFGSYRRYDLRQRILSVTNQAGIPVKDVNHQTNTDLRSDFQVNPKNKFSFIWLYNEQNRFFRRDGAYAFVSEEASWRQIEPAYILQGLWTSQITNNFLLDFRVGWNKEVFPLSYQPGVKPTDLNVQDVVRSTETGAAPVAFSNPAWVLRYSVSGSWYKGNFHGTHNVKFGFESGKAYNPYINKINQGINVLLKDGAAFEIIANNTPTTQKNYFRDTSFYVQDTWTIARRLTLDIGLRYDHFNTYYPTQATDPGVTFPQLFPQVTYPASGNLVDWNTVSPRIGLAFDVTGKGDSVVRFSYGRYYKMQGTGLAENTNPLGSASRTYSWTDTNNDGIPQQSEWLPQGANTVPVSVSGGTSTHIDSKMGRPYSEQVSASYERQIWRDLRVSATYYYRTKKNMIGLENTLVQPSDYTPITTLNDPVTGLPQPIINGVTGKPMTLFNFNPTPSRQLQFNFLVTNVPLLDDNAYHGLEFNVVKRLSHKWQILSGFTVQRQKGIFGRGYSDDAYFDNFNDPNLDINRKNNYLNNDATYVFKVDSSYELPLKIGTSVNFQHYTGFPIQPTETFGGYPNSGLAQFSETVILQPAGVLRLPSVNILNVRISRDFVLNDKWHVIPNVDFFNVTNAQTVIGEVGTFGSSYLFPFSTINPFVTRFGLRFTF